MNWQVDHLKVVLIAAGLVSCAAPFSSSAMSLGELTLHSRLGQPLHASILLEAELAEEQDSRCFSLARPESQGDFASYLTQAHLELVETRGRLQLRIRSTQTIHEPVLRLLVQGHCGQGHLSREYTLLLDPVEYPQARSPAVMQTISSEPQILKSQDQYVWDARQGDTLRYIAASLYPRQTRMQRNLLRAIRDLNPEMRGISPDAPLAEDSVIHVPVLLPLASRHAQSVDSTTQPDRVPVAVSKPVADTGNQTQRDLPAAQEGGFRLKLSTADLDLSMLGKMTEAQRQQLREKQLLLDADDQVANTLSMKNRIRQLEEQIGSMQKALEQTNSRMLLSERLAAPPLQSAAPPQPDSGTNWSSWVENTSFRGMAGVGLILALMVSAWWRWRRRQAETQLELELEHEFPANDTPQYVPFSPPQPEQHRTRANKPETTEQDDDYLLGVTSIFDHEGESVTFTEAESVLDEADLYMAYGWANRAIDLLQEYLEKHPDDVSLWKKLFEIYASQGMRQEFEQLALRCQSTMDDSGLWVLVQKLGRQLDAENPLYLSSPENFADGAVQSADVTKMERDEVPTLDTPLEFVLDRDPSPQPQPENDMESKHLELDPLFPSLFENTRPLPKNEKGGKDPG